MRYGGGFRLVIALLLIGAFAALTAGAYSAGFVAGAGANATNASPWVYGGFYGVSGIIGLIVTILILVIVFRILSFAFWRRSHAEWTERRGPNGEPLGPGDWHGPWGWHGRRGYWQEARRQMFDDWHREAHQAADQSGSTPNSGSNASSTGSQA